MYGQALPLAVTYLREEPDALMSARPGLCGGQPATAVPTAIANDTNYVLIQEEFVAMAVRVL